MLHHSWETLSVEPGEPGIAQESTVQSECMRCFLDKHDGPKGLFLPTVQPCAQLQQNSVAHCECDL